MQSVSRMWSIDDGPEKERQGLPKNMQRIVRSAASAKPTSQSWSGPTLAALQRLYCTTNSLTPLQACIKTGDANVEENTRTKVLQKRN